MERKPRIGLLGLMTGDYENIFHGILERQFEHGRSIARILSKDIEVTFDRIGTDQTAIEEIVKQYNQQELDGILIVLLAYSQGAWLTRAMKANLLPVALAVLQPDDVVDSQFEELDLTINQGIHGAQDNCNVLMRLGVSYQVFAGSKFSAEFKTFAVDFATAAQTAHMLNRLRVGVMGRMQGMGDILLDELAAFQKLGIEICHDSLGVVYQNMQQLNPEEITAEIEADRSRFEVDPKLSEESHSIAVSQYLGLRNYLTANSYGAFTIHFDTVTQDGRFRQLPLYAASRLMAEGYGYAAEGDIVCAAMVRAGHVISNAPAGFTEMYMMDQKTQSIIFCHAGEGNYASAAKNSKPRLIDRYLGEGGLENPPTILFMPKPGRATLISLVSVSGQKFRLVAAKGEILERDDMVRCEMPYFFFRPDNGMRACVEHWLKAGGTHHEVICLGDVSARWRMLCEMKGIEYIEA